MFEQFIGTKPVEERHRIDAAALGKFLGFEILEIAQFKGGQSNPTYRISSGDGRRFVLRRKPPGKLLPSAHAVEREFRVIQALHPTGFPVARPHVLCEDESVIGTAFYVMDFVDGRVLWDQSLPGMSRAGRAAIWDELNRVIARLHSIDFKEIGLETFGKPGSYIERQVARWSRQYQASETEPMEAMNNLIAWLPKNIPPETGTSVVHGDFRLDNAIYHPSEPRILAVVDWELSTLGHPLADFAYHAMVWRVPGGENRGLGGVDVTALGIPSESQYLEEYCRRTGRAGVAPDVWEFCMAYNLFRIACIRQGILRRVLDGTAASRHAREAGARARETAELAWAQVQAHFAPQGAAG